MSRLRDASNDYGHVSRVDGDQRLLNHTTQETYWREILDRNPTDSLHQIDLSSLRKLREGIIASGRNDAFSQTVFTKTARFAILLNHAESYLPCLTYLLSYSIHEMEEYYLLHLLSLSLSEYVHARVGFSRRFYFADQVFRALAQGNYVKWTTLRERADKWQAALLDRSAPLTRAMETISASYMGLKCDVLDSMFGTAWRDVARTKGYVVDGKECIFKRPRIKS